MNIMSRYVVAAVALVFILTAGFASAAGRSRSVSSGVASGQSSEPSDSKFETNVKNTSVTATAGLGASQNLNVGGIDMKGNTKGSSFKTNVQGVSVNAATGMGASQDVNFGGVSVK